MLTIQKLLACALAAYTLAALADAQGRAAGVAEWRQDVDEIVKDIYLLHPDPFAKTGRLNFLREAEALKTALPTLNEEQRVVGAMRLVASLGDGHTQLEPDNPAFAYWYPFRLYEFTDGLFVTSAHKSVAELAGAEVLEIAGRPAGEVVAEARKLSGAENEFDARERLFAVHSAALLKGLGYASKTGELKVKFKLRDGKVVERILAPSKTDHPNYKAGDSTFEWQYRREMYGLPFGTDGDWISAYKNLPAAAFQTEDAARPPHLTMRRPYFARTLPDQDAYYIQINRLDGGEFLPFLRKSLREVDEKKPRRLILDFRYNPGGDGSVVFDMIQEFVKREDAKPWKELYLLTGRKTFSAAIMALDAFADHTQFTAIGEPTGAAPNHFGDATSRSYLRTGLRLSVSTRRWQLSHSNDLSEFIPVEVPAPFSFADYAAGRDSALDPILRGEEMRSIPVVALAEGGAAARKVYEDRRARFAKYSWWSPPREIDLRDACRMLREQGRVADALETCHLNADIHPYIWNVWFNLGSTQRAAGLWLERLRSYRRVLEIDPNNFNRESLRRVLAEGLKPPVVRYGASVADIEAALSGLCKTTKTRRIDPPFLVLREIVKDKQIQIDCDGFQYLGEVRWAEFIFADDSLEMVWILTRGEEESALLKALTEAHGPPTRRNDKFIAFDGGRVALRLDRPELLFYSEKLAPRVSPWFDTPSTFR